MRIFSGTTQGWIRRSKTFATSWLKKLTVTFPLQKVSLVGGIRGQLAGLGRRLCKEAAEFAAGGVEGALLFLGVAVMDQRSTVVIDHIEE